MRPIALRSLFSLLVSSCLLAPASVLAADWQPDPSLPNPQIRQRLYDIGRRYCDEHFDPAANLLRQKLTSRDHMVVQSSGYAYGLLLTGNPADRQRGQAILRAILATQDTRPNSQWRGAFLWRAEDHWETIKNPDMNSAAFIGSMLESVADLDRRHPFLDPDLRKQVDQAGQLAVGEILRRNVDPGYSNIALLSTAVAAGGETLWHVPGAAKFAQSKLDTVLALADDGSIYEYLSPTYMAVDLGGAYGAKKFAFSDAFAAKAQAMIDHLWKEVAMSYDPPTYQLSGPFNRSYGENMLTYAAGLKYWLYLALDGNYPISDTETDHAWDLTGVMGLAATDIGPRPEFKLPVSAWREITVVGPNDGAHPTRHLFQYRQGNFVLGSVQVQDEWKQKRNLVAYWRIDLPGGNFRIGMCLDESNETLPNGFPYAQIHFYSHQVKNAALVALVASRTVPSTGSCCLIFNKEAQVAADSDASPVRIQDGSVTAYLYPVATGPASYHAKADDHLLHVTRDWATSDAVGNLHVLSYLIVFQPSDQPPPRVSNLALAPGPDGVTARAQVGSDSLALTFKN